MPEDATDRPQIPDEGGSAGDLFNDLISYIKSQEEDETIIRVDPDVARRIDEWQNDPNVTNKMQDIVSGRKTSIFGIVIGVSKVRDQTRVNYLDEYGDIVGFVYDTNSTKVQFKGLDEEGFKEGDFIVNEFTGQGFMFKSVEKVELPAEQRLAILETMRERFVPEE